MGFKYLFCLCFSALLPIFSQAKELHLQKELIALAADAPELFCYDLPALSKDGEKIAWTVRKKPAETYWDPAHQMKQGITPHYFGTKVLLKENDCKPVEIPNFGGNSYVPTWSPDGNSIAYYCEVDGQKNLWTYDLIQKASRKLSTMPVGGSFFIPKVVWGTHQKEIYVLTPSNPKKVNSTPSETSFSHFRSKEKIPDDDLGYNQLIAINTNDGTHRYLTDKEARFYISSFSASPSGSWIAYDTARWNDDPALKLHGVVADIGIVSADGNKQISLSQSLCRDHRYDIKYLWHPFLDQLYFIDQKQIWSAEFANGKLVKCELIPEILESVDASTLGFTRDGKSLILGADSVERYDDYSVEHPTKLLLIPLDGAKPQSYGLPQEWIFTGLVTNAKGIVWQPSSDCIAFTAMDKHQSLKSMLVLNLSTGETSSACEGKCWLSPIDFSPDHQTLHVEYEDFDTPKGIFRYDYSTKSFEAISSTEDGFSRVDPGSFHLIPSLVPGKEGKLEEVLTGIILPKGAKQGDRSPAIVVHYPGANCIAAASKFGGGDLMGGVPQWLFTNHGFAVILPNLVLGEAAIGKPLQVMTERLLPQITQAAELGYIDIDLLGIIGQSYGGYGTAGIISHTDLFRAAVATNGCYDLPSFSHHLEFTGKNIWMTWAEFDQGNMGLSLFEDPKRYIDNSPFYRADKIHTPILFIHGEMDDAYTDAGKIFSALRRLNRDAELVIYHKGHHLLGEMKREDHLNAIEHILNYFHHHLSP